MRQGSNLSRAYGKSRGYRNLCSDRPPPSVDRLKSNGDHNRCDGHHIHHRLISTRHKRPGRSCKGQCYARSRARVRENMPDCRDSSAPTDKYPNHERHQKRRLPGRRYQNVDDGVRNDRRNSERVQVNTTPNPTAKVRRLTTMPTLYALGSRY